MYEQNKPEILISGLSDDEPELIPLLTQEDEDSFNAESIPDVLPILPLRNTVLFPGVVIPITVGRDKSIKLIKDAYRTDKMIGVTSQKDSNVEDPKADDLNSIGTVATVMKMLQMPDGSTTIIIQGKRRMRIEKMVQFEPYYKAEVIPLKDEKPGKPDKEFKATVDSVKDLAVQIINISPNIPTEAQFAIKNIESPGFLIHFISSNMNADVVTKQEILEINNLKDRATKVLEHLTKEFQMLELKNQIQNKVRVDIDKQQREYFLNQQLRQIQEELGGTTPDQEVSALRERGSKKKWSKDIADHFNKECDRLQRLNPAAAEYSVTMNYLDVLLDLPWNEYTKDNFDLKRGQKILDKDHFGLEKVKQRIMEYLAVLKLKQDMKSPIICLYGPPGVGKTSLGKSIASALGRKYVRMSLGGLHDEAEIRGHRKTYIGAMPGRIVQQLRKAKSSNPVFVLDEIDKLSNTFHGDPSSALLEALDPEQNNSFYDNYLELGFDLSHVLFIATANSLSTIQPALRDRLEIIEVSGYTVEEKIQIALNHLMPKQLEAHGLKKKHMQLSEKVVEKIIDEYTSESGVRALEKNIASIARHVARNVAVGEKYASNISAEDVHKVLGAPRFKREKNLSNEVAGVVTGLAWTSVGGEILFIESSLSKGKGKMTVTGNLGNVMKESAVIAEAFLKAHAHDLGIKSEAFNNWDIHVHVPEGATPKDGPSAGDRKSTRLNSSHRT